MYLAIITWKANSSGSEDNHESNGSMSGVDELFNSRILFDNIRLERNLSENALLGTHREIPTSKVPKKEKCRKASKCDRVTG